MVDPKVKTIFRSEQVKVLADRMVLYQTSYRCCVTSNSKLLWTVVLLYLVPVFAFLRRQVNLENQVRPSGRRAPSGPEGLSPFVG